MRLIPLALAASIALAGCQSEVTDSAGERIRLASADASRDIADKAADAAGEVREKMLAENISLDGDHDGESRPKAEITPDGDILIGGEALPLDDRQRSLALAYRAEVIEVAANGADIGVQAASVATQAVGEAIASLVSGESSDIGKKVEADSKRIEDAARQLCDRVPALMDAQRALVEAVPEMAPYARIRTHSDGEHHCEIEA